ncbi:inner membrane protein [Natronospira proteinivora]|uniref:Inner membrane protein n=1 Tax=Natronospira proteinivora TaxID=1807133 RepID=A0ABT1G9N7_9GAMM|nr:metal-dependent hydrolase [Natronospira proteinivora]MCP1728039.1 inner membrane protein [Natronospira proteinivora]
MDPFTHALSGAVGNRALGPTRPAPGQFSHGERLFLGGAFALWPDMDWVIHLFADELVYLNLHRGVTHSLVMLPFWSLLLGWLLCRYWPRHRDWRDGVRIVAVSTGLHILGDFITSYGTQLFAPLSSQALAFPSTFIIDPWMTLILLLGMLLLWRGYGRTTARISLGLVVALVLFQGSMKLQALEIGQQMARAQGPGPHSVHALPQPISPLHWRLVVEHEDHHLEAHLGFLRRPDPVPTRSNALTRHWGVFRPPGHLEWRAYPRFGEGDEAVFARAAWYQPAFSGFRQFAGLPYLLGVEMQDDRRCAVFTDLRFRTEGFPSPFRFAMCEDGEGQWERQRKGQW